MAGRCGGGGLLVRGIPRVLRGIPRVVMQPSPWTRSHTCHMRPSDLEVSNMDATPGRGEKPCLSSSNVGGFCGGSAVIHALGAPRSVASQRHQSFRIGVPVRPVVDVYCVGEVIASD